MLKEVQLIASTNNQGHIEYILTSPLKEKLLDENKIVIGPKNIGWIRCTGLDNTLSALCPISEDILNQIIENGGNCLIEVEDFPDIEPSRVIMSGGIGMINPHYRTWEENKSKFIPKPILFDNKVIIVYGNLTN